MKKQPAKQPANETTPLMEIQDLRASVEGKEILKGLSLRILPGEMHALMGRNGSGKTTLSIVIMGHPKYKVESGDILFQGKSLLGLGPDARAKAGVFMAFQYPTAVPGVAVANFLREANLAVHGEAARKGFRKSVKEKLKAFGIPETFMTRYLNDGFSGGEKKRLEVLQMAVLEPAFCILDETDSGLDLDALKVVSEGVNRLRDATRSFLLITHYPRMLDAFRPDRVHVLQEGQIIKSGDFSLADELEKHGYEHLYGEDLSATAHHA